MATTVNITLSLEVSRNMRKLYFFLFDFSYLVKFSTSDTISNRPLTLECRFSRIQRYRTREQSGIANGLETLKVPDIVR